MLLKTFRKPQVWLGVLISLTALGLVIWSLDLAALGEVLRRSRWGLLLPAAAGVATFLLARAARWRILLGRTIGYQPVLHVQNVGYLLGLFLPLRLGDVVRTVLIGRIPPATFWQGASTMVVERLLDLLVFVVLFPFAIANLNQVPQALQEAARISGVIALLGFVVFLVLARNRPWLERQIMRRLPESISRRAAELLDGLSAFNRWQDLAEIALWTLLIWLPAGLAYFWVMQAVGLQLTFWEVAFVLCAAAFAVAIPSSPGQLGVFQAAVFFALHTVMGYAEEPSFGFAILFHAVQYTIFAALGALGMSRTGHSWSSIVALARRQLNRSEGGQQEGEDEREGSD